MLVARNNPVLWLMLECIARAPTREQLLKPLSKLLISRRGTETIEAHLKSIYATPCANCGQMIQPEGFIWELSGVQPIGRVYNCPLCGDSGEKEIGGDCHKTERLGNWAARRAPSRVQQGGDYEQHSLQALRIVICRAACTCA